MDTIDTGLAARDGFAEPTPILVVTADDQLAGSMFVALDQLTLPFMRAGTLGEAARLCRLHTFDLLLIDGRINDHRGDLPADLRGELNAETTWLRIARADESPHRPDAIRCYDGGVASDAIAAFISDELDRVALARLLATARLLVAAPGRLSAVPIPPALQAAHRLDWMYRHQPSLENAAALVGHQENLSKHVMRLAQALSGDVQMRSPDLGRVVLHLGLMRLIPLVKIVAARLMFPVRDPGRRHSLDAIWRFSVGRAIAMQALTARLPPEVDQGGWQLAFDAGLFADAGAGLLIWLLEQSEPRRLRARGLASLSQPMLAFHEWLGEGLLERWKQPRALAHVAGGHHPTPGSATVTMRSLALAAAALVEDAGVGPDHTGASNPGGAGLAFDQLSPLRVSSTDRQQITSLIRVELQRIEEAFVP